ncbi:hypothetical protein HDV00_001897 [Rhizophlyctis rosea]|nr:hypothetical protein HDV00_001897 [Rhizophlyctis rosea]
MLAKVVLASTFFAATALAASAYGQCGGSGFTGDTSCPSGYACVVSNAWYSQCVQSSGGGVGSSPTTTKASTTKAATTTKVVATTAKTTTTVKKTTTTTVKPNTTAASSGSTPTGTYCGQWDSKTVGPYTFYADLWGQADATFGSQCSSINTASDPVTWTTQFTWTGAPYQVKSYSQIQLAKPKVLSSIKSIPSTWSYTVNYSSGTVMDIAYDLFLGPTSGGTNTVEIMIWLAAIGGAGPISTTGSTPAKTFSYGGGTWNLFVGSNGSQQVHSFVRSSQTTNFSGDLLQFLNFLTTNGYFSTSLYLNSIASGTEPFVGSATLKSTFSCAIN